MGKTILAISSLIFLLGVSSPGYAGDGPEGSGVGVAVELRDGSRVKGAALLESLRVRSPAIGDLEVPISKVKRIVFGDKEEAPRVFLTNGDILTGPLAVSELEMQTLFGNIAIPLEAAVSLERSAWGHLIACYSFNGSAHDSSGNHIHGEVHGATLCEDRHGNKDSAYQFDGVDDYIKFGQVLPDMEEMTICAWVFAENKAGWLNDGDWALHNDVVIGAGPSSVSLRADKGGHQLNEELDVGVEMRHRWRHIAWTMTAEQSNVYVDGSHCASVKKGGSNVGFHNFILGTQEYPQGVMGWMGYWKGRISSLRIYSRVMTAEEIRKVCDEAG